MGEVDLDALAKELGFALKPEQKSKKAGDRPTQTTKFVKFAVAIL